MLGTRTGEWDDWEGDGRKSVLAVCDSKAGTGGSGRLAGLCGMTTGDRRGGGGGGEGWWVWGWSGC